MPKLRQYSDKSFIVPIKGKVIRFANNPAQRTYIKSRVDRIMGKEPETINWINKFKKNSIFFDVGANIGIYTLYSAVKIGNIAGANEALYIQITNFRQKGVPTEKQKDKEEEEEPETGLFGWIVKEAVKAKIDKEMENVERYPNNIQTVIDGEVSLLNVETNQSIASFLFNAEHTGGVKSKSIKED